jgi:hypothetical protein
MTNKTTITRMKQAPHIVASGQKHQYQLVSNQKAADVKALSRKVYQHLLITGKNSLPEYKINPISIPRPNKMEDIYVNVDQTHYFQTEDYSKHNIPYSHQFFIVNETKNSSIRFIRSTMNTLPTSMDKVTKSGLLLGCYVQPFAKLMQGEFEVPSIEGNIIVLTIQLRMIYLDVRNAMRI